MRPKAEAVRLRRLLKARGEASASSGPKVKAMPRKVRTKAMPKKPKQKAMPKPPHHSRTVQREIALSQKEVRGLPILTLEDHLERHQKAVLEANRVANLMKPLAVDQRELEIGFEVCDFSARDF